MNLEKLFDFQKFENNSRLAKLIAETESRYSKALSDDDLDMVNAAGVPEIFQNSGEKSTDERKNH